MKTIAILFVFGIVASAIEQVKFQVPADKVAKLRKIADGCAQELNVDPEYIKRIPDGTLPTDETSMKYLYCATMKTGLVKEDGHMIADKVGDLLGDHPLKEAVKEAINKCNEVTKENHLETLKEMNRCFTTTVPVLYVV